MCKTNSGLAKKLSCGQLNWWCTGPEKATLEKMCENKGTHFTPQDTQIVHIHKPEIL